MSDDHMRYDLLAQEALRQVVRRALEIAARHGLPGDHHFYISFRTEAPGVEISDRIRGQYPSEMTIVLQHQFWNLEVMDDRFSVELSFGKIPEKLVIPYAALQAFHDPSVQFGLQFTHFSGTEALARINSPNPEAIENDAADDAKPAGDGDVVSLDAFRKK